jgi:hypothetical protein
MIDIMIHTTDRRAEKVHMHLMYGIKVPHPPDLSIAEIAGLEGIYRLIKMSMDGRQA